MYIRKVYLMHYRLRQNTNLYGDVLNTLSEYIYILLHITKYHFKEKKKDIFCIIYFALRNFFYIYVKKHSFGQKKQ